MIQKFAGPCAQGVLDPLIIPRPMSSCPAVMGLCYVYNILLDCHPGDIRSRQCGTCPLLARYSPATCPLLARYSPVTCKFLGRVAAFHSACQAAIGAGQGPKNDVQKITK